MDKTIKKGDILSCKVEVVSKTYLLVKLPNSEKVVVHISNISDYYVPSLNNMFEINNHYDFEVIDSKINNIKLSWKVLNPRFLKNPFKFEIIETEKGFQNLKKFVTKEIENA